MIGRHDLIDHESSHSGSIELSLIIPAYNEARRLPGTLDTAVHFLQTWGISWELIVADDGSTDATPEIVVAAAKSNTQIRHLRLPHRGKAAAVHAGVREARGQIVIFTDADLSTPIDYITNARDQLRSGCDVVVGTREGRGAERRGEPIYRHLMGRLFNYVVQLVAVPGIRDSQCGFKAFSAAAAFEIFSRARLYRDGAKPVRGPLVTGFDVELLFLARRLNYRICELPVIWGHVEGSKVRPGIDSILMVRDVFKVRMNAIAGRYDQPLAGAQESKRPREGRASGQGWTKPPER